MPWIELGVDLRQVQPDCLKDEFVAALGDITGNSAESRKRVYLEAFCPIRSSIIWRFNNLFWQHLPLWENAAGHGFEKSLPGGTSDANHPEAIRDSVADFWTLLKDLDSRKQLPQEIFALEIGVGTGQRAAAWLDRFRALDHERGTNYYPRVRFLLADYSMPALNRATGSRSRTSRTGEFPGGRCAGSIQIAVVPSLQSSLDPPHERLRQPAYR